MKNTFTNTINESEWIDRLRTAFSRNKYLSHPAAPIFAFILLFALLPLLIGREVFLTTILAFTVFAISYNLVLGYSGLLAFGHAAFFGIGSYVFIFAGNNGFSLVFGLIAVALVSGIAGVVMGIISLRRRGLYFAMITLAIAQGIYGFVFYSQFTGGDNGLIVESRQMPILLGLGEMDFTNTLLAYYFVLVAALVVILLFYRIVRSPFGLTLQAIRENEERANHLGYDVQFSLLSSFTISAIFSGIAGAMLIMMVGITSPDNIHWLTTGEMVIMVVLGGVHTFMGPAVGTILFFGLSEFFIQLTDNFQLFLGIAMVIIVLGLPEGVVPSLRNKLNL